MIAAVAFLIAVCVATTTATILGLTFAKLTPAIAITALGLGAIAGGLSFLLPRPAKRRITLVETLLFIVFVLFALRAFCWVLYADDTEMKVLSPNNLGDMSLHLTYINSLVRGAKFWPENAIFAGSSLHYPVGMDLFSSLLVLAGMDVVRSLIWVGLIASLLCAVSLRQWGGSFAIAGFLFNGGLAGFRYFASGRFADYNDAVDWKSIPLALFVTQRGLLYAIPVGIVLLTSWRSRWLSREDPARFRLPLAVEVLLFSTLPLFHVHTFLFLSLLLAAATLAIACSKSASPAPAQSAFHPAAVLAGSLIPAAISIGLVTGLFSPNSAARGMIHLSPGWMQGDQNFLVYWSMNFGVLPLLVAALLALSLRPGGEADERLATWCFVVPSVAIFLGACLVMLAPWNWDNTKMMLWCYLTVLPFLWKHLLQKLPLVLQAAACFVLFFSGFVSLFGGLDRSHHGYKIASRVELDGVAHAVRRLNPNATFAAFPTYNHPLLLDGCKLVEGYSPHLFSHGIDYQPRLVQLQSLMSGQSDWREAGRALDVRYLFWGEREEKEYADSTTPWRGECPVIASGAWGTIYDLAP